MTAMRRRAEEAEERPDAELLGLAYAGDREALGALYDRHAQAVFGFTRRFTSAPEAEDIVQVTFLRIVEIAGDYDNRCLSSRGWIFGVAYRVMRERRRSLSRFLRFLEGYGDERRSRVEHREEATDVERALLRLAEPKRTVLVLTVVEGFTAQEVATMLGVPLGTIWTRLHHARRELHTAGSRVDRRSPQEAERPPHDPDGQGGTRAPGPHGAGHADAAGAGSGQGLLLGDLPVQRAEPTRHR